jgi:TM2 domain-containing membrane protein YozV
VTAPLPPSGWYPDPSGAPGQRYFDGKEWTEHRPGAPVSLPYGQWPQPLSSGHPYPATPSPYGYPGYPAPGYGVDPAAPYGRDPATGEPLSDKSALAAGLLQVFFGIFGIGRFYIGSPVIGAIQLGLMFLSAMLMIVLIGFFMMACLALWVLIDGVLMICGVVKDGKGRKLRPAGN